MEYSVIIRNGKIMDGSGNPWYKGDIVISDEKILAIGKFKGESADQVIDASGLVVAPGWIDIHTHSEPTLWVNPKAESKIRQGVTTEVIGLCGISISPVNKDRLEDLLHAFEILVNIGQQIMPTLPWNWSTFDEFYKIMEERGGASVNIASFTGHTILRTAVMGAEPRLATEDEIEQMKLLLAQSMEDGSFGLSSGLQFPVGMNSDVHEIVELCKVIAEYGGCYHTHIRNQSEGIVEATLEAIEVAEKAGVPVQISHHVPKSLGGWGKSKELLQIQDEAKKRGVDIAFDDYYTFLYGLPGDEWLVSTFPPWSHDGGKGKLIERLTDPKTREKIRADILDSASKPAAARSMAGLIASGRFDLMILLAAEKNKDFVGKSFAEIANIRGVDPLEVFFDILVEENAKYEIAYVHQTREDARELAVHPLSMVASDNKCYAPYGVLEKFGDVRGYGTFPAFIETYVNKERLLTMEEAVRKMTSFPAQRLGLRDRGFIREGNWADIVIFDPNTIRNNATLLEPNQYPDGIRYVIVNGKLTVDESEHKGVLAGKILRLNTKAKAKARKS